MFRFAVVDPIVRLAGETDPRFLDNFDLIVLGGGPAGTSAASAAGLLVKRVTLVERASFVDPHMIRVISDGKREPLRGETRVIPECRRAVHAAIRVGEGVQRAEGPLRSAGRADTPEARYTLPDSARPHPRTVHAAAALLDVNRRPRVEDAQAWNPPPGLTNEK